MVRNGMGGFGKRGFGTGGFRTRPYGRSARGDGGIEPTCAVWDQQIRVFMRGVGNKFEI